MIELKDGIREINFNNLTTLVPILEVLGQRKDEYRIKGLL
jgi:hypothetical protein